MSEVAASPETTTTTPAIDPAVKAQIDQQMNASLKDFVPTNVLPAAPASEPAAGNEGGTGGPAPGVVADPFGIFKEKFGYESPEAAITDIEALRAFRASPPVAELKFENEQSKLIAEALQAGKFNDVYDILDQQVRIDRMTTGELTPETAANVIKEGMRLKFKDLKPEEINWKFNKQYGLPPKPAMSPAEDQEEYNERIKGWEAQVADKQMELMIDAKFARPDLVAAKTKLVFPTIARPQEAEFLEWQKTNQENDRLSAEAVEAYKAFTPKSLETKLNFKDEPNKIDFDFTHEPEAQVFGQTVEMVSNIQKLWDQFFASDGTPRRKEFLEFVYFGLNRNKILLDAMNQAKNAVIKSMLPDNSTGGMVRQMPQTQEPDWLEKNMRESLRGYGGF